MAPLKEKIQTGLDETRIVVLGSQVAVGLQLEAIFQAEFTRLPQSVQEVHLAGLLLMLLSLGFLMAPCAYHRIVSGGHSSVGMHKFTTLMAGGALLPFAMAMGLLGYVCVGFRFGYGFGAVFGAITTVLALAFWYGLGYLKRGRGIRRRTLVVPEDENALECEDTPLKDRVRQVLTELRVALPGAQALLGFQFVVMLSGGFDSLPESSRIIHLLSLVLTAISVIFLMTPGAYHRLVLDGENSEDFEQFCGKMLVAAMAALGAALSADFYVVSAKVIHSNRTAAALSVALLAVFYGLWFGYTASVRNREGNALRRSSHPASPAST